MIYAFSLSKLEQFCKLGFPRASPQYAEDFLWGQGRRGREHTGSEPRMKAVWSNCIVKLTQGFSPPLLLIASPPALLIPRKLESHIDPSMLDIQQIIPNPNTTNFLLHP